MKHLYKEQNTFRILPINFMHNLGILLRYSNWGGDGECVYVVEEYYNWAMGRELTFQQGEELYKAFVLLGDTMNIQDYNARLEVWYRHNVQ